MARRDTDPYAAFNFKLELGGITQGAFSECSGLSVEADVIEDRDGTEKPLSVRKQPGLFKYTNVTLKRGITKDKALFDWLKKGIDGDVDRKDTVSIVVNDEKGSEAVRWNLLQAFPNKWTGPDLKAAGGTELAVESIEFVCEAVEWA
ncbi:MAG: phage tail protein [Acidobacteriota bacterium]|nr:phage tail protein [Acidobacteriota bacterium]